MTSSLPSTTGTVAQILLTGEDVESPVRSEHLHNTFEALLELGVDPGGQ